MDVLSSNERQKILRRKLKDFNKQNGFRFVTSRIVLREQNNIVQYISFIIKQGFMTADVVTQPLYIEAESYILNVCFRINHLRKGKKRHWAEFHQSEEEFCLDVDEIIDILQNEGLRWFEYSQTPEALIQMSLDKNLEITQGYNIHARLYTVAMSYLYIGDTEKGIMYLEKYIDELIEYRKTINNGTLTESDKMRIDNLLQWLDLAKNTPERLPEIFKGIIARTRLALKLDK